MSLCRGSGREFLSLAGVTLRRSLPAPASLREGAGHRRKTPVIRGGVQKLLSVARQSGVHRPPCQALTYLIKKSGGQVYWGQ